MSQVIHLGDFYRIAAALINKFRSTINMRNADIALARRIRDKSIRINRLRIRVLENSMAHIRANWTLLNFNHFPDFPNFDLECLSELLFGVYQIGLAPSFIQDSFEEGANVFEIDQRITEPGLLRCRLSSMFRNAVKYQLWIKYYSNSLENNHEEMDNDYLQKWIENSGVLFPYL